MTTLFNLVFDFFDSLLLFQKIFNQIIGFLQED